MPYIHGWHTKEPHIIHCMHFATGAGVSICGGGGGRGGGGGGGGGASEPTEPDSAESAERHTPKDRKSLTPAK